MLYDCQVHIYTKTGPKYRIVYVIIVQKNMKHPTQNITQFVNFTKLKIALICS
jgi:outer membrane protein assembly factor BamA